MTADPTRETSRRAASPLRRPTALVLGGSAIEIIRSLQLAGIPTAAVVPDNDATRYSSRTDVPFTWDWAQPMHAHNEALAERLIAWASTQPEPPVLFYCSDQALLFVSRHRERLSRAFRLVVPEPDLVESLVDKATFATLARRLSLPVPATTVLDPAASCDGQPPQLDSLGYPLIIKPERRERDWRDVGPTKVKALVIESPARLRETWPRLAQLRRTLLAQRYIGGPESQILSYHCYVRDDGEIVAEFTGQKIRTFPSRCGFTTALRITHDAEVLAAGREQTRRLGLTGVAKFDFKRCPVDHQLYLFEVNARTSLWVHPGARAGVNLSAAIYADLVGEPRPTLRTRPLPVTWVHPKDLFAAREEKLGLTRWALFAASCEAKAFWNWRDPMPFVRMVLSRARSGDFT